MSYQFVKTEIRENVGILTISRPEKLNALSRVVVNDLSQAFDDFENNELIRAIVITGEGDKSFVQDQRCAAAKAGLDAIREVAKEHPYPTQEVHPQAETQGRSRTQPVHQNPPQESR